MPHVFIPRFALLLCLLFPSVAFACIWGGGQDPTSPLDFLVVAHIISAIVAMGLIIRDRQHSRYIPELIIVLSFVAASGLSILIAFLGDMPLFREGRLTTVLVILALTFPYLMMRLRPRSSWQKGALILFLLLFLANSLSSFVSLFGTQPTGPLPATTEEVQTDVVF